MNETLNAIMKQYEEASNSNSSGSKTYDLKNYFTTHLADGVNSAQKTIRILPGENGESPFVVMNVHKYKVDGEWKTYPCLKQEEDKDCPFCETRAELLATGNETDKETAKDFRHRKMFVVKVVDREKEAEGIKFWRFNDNWKKEGTFDKIASILKALQKDITDADNGIDLVVSIARNDKKQPIIQGIIPLGESPLHKDETTKKAWLSDSRTWRDVYSVRDYNYLEIVVKGGVPAFDKVNECWVDKASLTETASDAKSSNTSAADLTSELTLGKGTTNLVAETAKTTPVVPVTTVTAPVAPVAATNTDVEDDLPF